MILRKRWKIKRRNMSMTSTSRKIILKRRKKKWRKMLRKEWRTMTITMAWTRHRKTLRKHKKIYRKKQTKYSRIMTKKLTRLMRASTKPRIILKKRHIK